MDKNRYPGFNPIVIEPLTREAFAPFGQVISIEGAPHYAINGGRTERYHDLANIELDGESPRPLISIFRGKPVSLPLAIGGLEAHPLGSQAFYPLSPHPYLVIVATSLPPPRHDPHRHMGPHEVRAFRAAPGQGVNIAKGVWHATLSPLEAVSDFLVVDRGGPGDNLREADFLIPLLIVEA